MESINSKHIVRRFFCRVLLLQMLHVSPDNISSFGFSARVFFYKAHSLVSPTYTDFEWPAITFFNALLSHQDVPSGDKNEEGSFLEDLSNCLLWPPFTPEFNLDGNAECLSDNFDPFADNFVTHYSEPHSPPPNRVKYRALV
jgi:hypothetical protein